MSGHIITRQGRFAWRRTIRGITIQIPLRTTDRRAAAEIGAAATAASYAVFHDILHRGLDRTTGRGIIERSATAAWARLILRENDMFFFPWPYEPPRVMRERGHTQASIETWIRGRAEHPTEEDFRGWDAKDVAEYKAVQEGAPSPKPVETSPQSSVVIHNHYHAPTAANTVQAPAPVPELPAPSKTALLRAPAAAPQPAANAGEEPENTVPAPAGRTPIPDLVETIIASDRRRNRVNDATAKGFRTSIALFCEICRINDVEEITQDGLTLFCETLERIPPNYRRGSTGRATPIFDIIEKAERDGVPTGLSAKTVNKQLEALKKLIKHGKTRVQMPDLEVSILRVRDAESAKEKRDPFTLDEIRALFKQPHLNLSSERGALWWCAHLAAYTGARREEIAALSKADIGVIDDIPVIHIKTNDYRSLKNGQSRRFVPVHPDLIDLGFLDYVKGRKPGLLFEIKRKGRTYGNDFEYRWQKARKSVVGKDPRKVFHSFRHSAVQALKDADVPLPVRADLFGHDHDHIQDTIYGALGKAATLLNAVKLLPSVR